MIDDKIISALNAQISKEFYSAYFYLSMVAYFSEIGLSGFAKWTSAQAKEEIDHGMKIFDYIIDHNGKIELYTIDSPEIKFNSPLDVFQKALAHEREITAALNAVSKIAETQNDRATRIFLDWFIAEQAEEETKFRTIIEKLKLFGDDCTSLYLLDKETGA